MVSLLADTHVVLWLLGGERGRFGAKTLEMLRDGTTVISAATVWEVSIKRSTGKLKAPADLLDLLLDAGLQLLSISAAHAARVAELPDLHRDPFDRMLVAQAQLEGLTILTADGEISRYEVPTADPGR